jgi:hypothetical protein
MMMVADLGAAHTAEKFLGPICACAVEAVSLFMIDPLPCHVLFGVPCGARIGRRGTGGNLATLNRNVWVIVVIEPEIHSLYVVL